MFCFAVAEEELRVLVGDGMGRDGTYGCGCCGTLGEGLGSVVDVLRFGYKWGEGFT